MGYVVTPLTWTTFKKIIDDSMGEICASFSIPYSPVHVMFWLSPMFCRPVDFMRLL